ncbi:unnamed protein product, partial [Polarella glacialis]
MFNAITLKSRDLALHDGSMTNIGAFGPLDMAYDTQSCMKHCEVAEAGMSMLQLIAERVGQQDSTKASMASDFPGAPLIFNEKFEETALRKAHEELADGIIKGFLQIKALRGAALGAVVEAEIRGALGAEELVARVLSSVLRPRCRCWAFAPHADAVSAGRASLGAMSPDVHRTLLEALRRNDESFCAVVRRHLGRSEGSPLLKLGRPRAAWLLGAAADDPAALGAPKEG